MRFPPRTLRDHCKFNALWTLCRAAGRVVFGAALLAPWFLPGTSLADDFDVALHSRDVTVGEFSGRTNLGPLALAIRHSEYLGFLNRAYLEGGQEEDAPKNPLARSTRLQTTGTLGIDADAALPLGAALALDEWDSGDRELRVTGSSGFNLNGFRLDHSLTVVTRFAADGTESRRSNGRLRLGGAFLGGTQEGILEYDALPVGQITRLAIHADWRFVGDSAVRVDFMHRPLTRVSQAQFGISSPLGPFNMSSDIAADSTGAYTLGISFSLDLGAPAEAAETWRLSSLLAALRAERRPSLP